MWFHIIHQTYYILSKPQAILSYVDTLDGRKEKSG